MLEDAIEAAQEAGKVLSTYFERIGLEHEVKDDKSFVTKADKEAEEVIVSLITQRYPDHGILGEEGSEVNPQAEFQWVIDPLDGTSNFINGIPIFGVSIAVVQAGVPVVGVVYSPLTHSLYAAEKGKGTTYNGKQVRVSVQEASAGLVTLGPGVGERQRVRELFGATAPYFKSARFLGSTAMELAYIARGGTEGYVCLGLKPWDYAAGRLLVTEAGGRITDFNGNDCDLTQNYFIASNGVAHETLKALVASVPAN